jgi:hypothetical protein
MLLKIHPRNPLVCGLIRILAAHDNAEERILEHALLQGRNECLWQSHAYIFIFNLVDCAYYQRVVEADVLAADCAAFVGA